MKIKELRKSIEKITTSWDSPEQRIDKLLNLFTKTMGEEREIIMEELNLWRPIFYRDKVTDKDMKVLRQEMRSKLK
jgi:hypothetical protein